LRGALRDQLRVHAAQHPDVREQLGTAEPIEQPGRVREHTEQAFRLYRIRPHVVTEHERGSGVRSQETDRHGERGGLAGTVRTDQAIDRTGWHVEGDPPDHRPAIERLDQAPQHERGLWLTISHVTTLSALTGALVPLDARNPWPGSPPLDGRQAQLIDGDELRPRDAPVVAPAAKCGHDKARPAESGRALGSAVTT